MGLFQTGDFTLHSGDKAAWKIDCDSSTDDDWAALALMLVERLPPFRGVVGVPRGGWPLERALTPYVKDDDRLPLLLCDDVLTTGASLERLRDVMVKPSVGAVVFARGPCPPWVTPLFQMTPPRNV